MTSNIIQKIFQPGGRGKVWRIFVFIILLILGGGLVDAGQHYNKGVDWVAAKTKDVVKLPRAKEINFRLGLDLQGGTQLTYNADLSAVPAKDKASAVEGARDVIERRVNVFGVSEPNVQTNRSGDDYQIIAELAGIKDIKEAIKMIGETPILEFKEQTGEKRQLTDEEKKQLEDFNKEAEKKAEEVLGKVLSGGDFEALAREFSQDEKTKEAGGDLGWITENDNLQMVVFARELKKGEATKDLKRTGDGFEIMKMEDERVKTDPFANESEKEVKASHLLICYKDISGCESGLTKEEALEKIKKLKATASPVNFSTLIKQNSTEPGARDSGGELGWFGKGKMVKPFEEAVFSQAVGAISEPIETEFGYHLIYKQDEREIKEYKVRRILIRTMKESDIIGAQSDWKNTELTGKNLKWASVQFDPNSGVPEVSLEFDDEGAKMFADITGRNVGKPVAIFLDGYPISVPTVNEKITGGKAVISGNFNIKEAKLLAQRLNAGALPVPITLVNQQTVGATLGQKSVSDSLRAGIIGFLLVALFMIIFYRLPGLVAVFSLAIYGILVLAVFKLWPVTLTLAGLAGFIMSIGMAVDANILIFARFKEELRLGKPVAMALEEGFKRAWLSIRDSNVSTLITCFILAEFSTSIVKGFAVTLALGVIVSMFTAIVITRNLLNLVMGRWVEKRMWLAGSGKTEK
ncbi:protein translocase subunit SecD [Candidatus Falkowbacteria bacterium]|nr:protein translocase subunit SecD [Candidatus Falkowbacteria bacterium]